MMELFEELSNEGRELWWASLLAEILPVNNGNFELEHDEPNNSLIRYCSKKEVI
jgi:hypothetical protein